MSELYPTKKYLSYFILYPSMGFGFLLSFVHRAMNEEIQISLKSGFHFFWNIPRGRVQLFVTPWTTQSMEFSRPEHWSGEPFPSPGDLPSPRIEPRSPARQADSFPAKPPGKPNNTGVGSLSLLQQILPTKELNCSLLHFTCLLYQMNCQGSPVCSSYSN